MAQINNEKKENFWDSTLGTITKLTAFITAITALIIAINDFTSKFKNPAEVRHTRADPEASTPLSTNQEDKDESGSTEIHEKQEPGKVDYVYGTWMTSFSESVSQGEDDVRSMTVEMIYNFDRKSICESTTKMHFFALDGKKYSITVSGTGSYDIADDVISMRFTDLKSSPHPQNSAQFESYPETCKKILRDMHLDKEIFAYFKILRIGNTEMLVEDQSTKNKFHFTKQS